MLKVAFQRTMSFLFGSPFEKSTRVFLFVRATEKHTTLVDAFLFHLSGYTQKSVTTHWKYWRLYIAPHPKGTWILLTSQNTRKRVFHNSLSSHL